MKQNRLREMQMFFKHFFHAVIAKHSDQCILTERFFRYHRAPSCQLSVTDK